MKSKPLAMNSNNLLTWTATMWSLQRPNTKEEGASHFIPRQKQSLQSNNQDIVNVWFFYEKKSMTSQPNFESLSPWIFLLPCRHFKLRQPLDCGLYYEESRGQILGFLHSDWWKSMASQPLAIVWSGPNLGFGYGVNSIEQKSQTNCSKAFILDEWEVWTYATF